MSTFQQAVIRHGIVGLIIGVTLAGSSVAMGEPVEDFYKGRQLRIVIRAGPGAITICTHGCSCGTWFDPSPVDPPPWR
jgi:hypothetical protein